MAPQRWNGEKRVDPAVILARGKAISDALELAAIETLIRLDEIERGG